MLDRRFIVPLVLTALLATAAGAHNVFVVNRPQDLRFVPLREPFLAIKSRFGQRADLLDRIRGEVFATMSQRWGIPRPDKKDVAVGCVARTDAGGRLAFALILRGEVDPGKVKDHLIRQHAKAFGRRGLTSRPQEVSAGGHKAWRLPYSERNSAYSIVPLERMVVLASTPNDDASLLEETLQALALPDRLGQGPPPSVDLHARVDALTPREAQRVREFQTKSVSPGVDKIRDRFRTLHDRLRPGGAREEDLKSLDERLTDQFLRASRFEIRVQYRAGSSPGDDGYGGELAMSFPTPDDAQAMRALLLEKALFFKENAASPSIPRSLDQATVDASGRTVTVKIALDTPEEQYDAAFSYLAFLLSFSSADRWLGISRGK